MSDISLRTWIDKFDKGEFDSPDRDTRKFFEV